MNRSITAATENPGKLREIREVLASLDISTCGLEKWADIPPPAENGNTFAENARKKALYYAKKTGNLCLADDSGLIVDALEGMPGVRSARFASDTLPPRANRDQIDRANNKKLISLLKNVPEQDRTARFVCHLVLADPEKVILETHGTIEGRIITNPKGKNGFGYDPHFYIPGKGCTSAELAPEEKNLVSHRGKALQELARKIKDLNIL